MNHLQIYSDIINNALSKNRKKLKRDDENYIYYERHHILPKCLDGGNEKENLVLLTGKEHFVCHKLLVEIFPKERGLICAYFLMCTTNNIDRRDYKISSREYERVKKIVSENHSEFMLGENNPIYGKIGELAPMAGKTHSKESKKKIGEAQKGKKQKIVKCIYCGFEGGIRNMKRYHFDNCLENPQSDKEEILKKRREENSMLIGKKQKLTICSWCGFTGGDKNMIRYHFNNCLQNPSLSEKDKEKIMQNRKDIKVKTVTCIYCDVIMDAGNAKKFHFDNCLQNPKNNKEEIEKSRKQKIVKCLYCNKTGGAANMKRYHFDNCKFKKII